MARITVEDCLDHVENRSRFHLSLLASRRARQLREGAHPLVRSEEDDYTVLALREIATGDITVEFLDRIDRELGGPSHAEAAEPSADSVADAAEALGAGMAAGAEAPEGAAPEAAGAEEDTPQPAEDADSSAEEGEAGESGPADRGEES